MRCNQGFTLIELLIVLAIIGILASIAMPAFQKNITKAQITEAINLAQGLKIVIQENRAQGNCYSNGNIPSSRDQIISKYGKAEVVQHNNAGQLECGIKYTFNRQGISRELQGKMIEFYVNENAIIYNRTTTTVDSDLLPVSVR